MSRSVALLGGAVLVLLVASQLALPPLASRRIEHRLTARGGSAHVSLHAFPALRLLFHHGSSVDVTGSGLDVDLGTGRQKVFHNLDGFGEVHVRLNDVTAGPFHTRSFTLERDNGDSAYRLGVDASFTPSALASYLGSRVGGGLGGLFGGLAGGLVPGGSQPVPVDVRARVESQDGTPVVQSGAGTVAGVPMGPLLEAVTTAIVARLRPFWPPHAGVHAGGMEVPSTPGAPEQPMPDPGSPSVPDPEPSPTPDPGTPTVPEPAPPEQPDPASPDVPEPDPKGPEVPDEPPGRPEPQIPPGGP